MDNIVDFNRFLVNSLKIKIEDDLDDKDESCLVLPNNVVVFVYCDYVKRREGEFERDIIFKISGVEEKDNIFSETYKGVELKKRVSNLDNFENILLWAYNVALSKEEN